MQRKVLLDKRLKAFKIHYRLCKRGAPSDKHAGAFTSYIHVNNRLLAVCKFSFSTNAINNKFAAHFCSHYIHVLFFPRWGGGGDGLATLQQACNQLYDWKQSRFVRKHFENSASMLFFQQSLLYHLCQFCLFLLHCAFETFVLGEIMFKYIILQVQQLYVVDTGKHTHSTQNSSTS